MTHKCRRRKRRSAGRRQSISRTSVPHFGIQRRYSRGGVPSNSTLRPKRQTVSSIQLTRLSSWSIHMRRRLDMNRGSSLRPRPTTRAGTQGETMATTLIRRPESTQMHFQKEVETITLLRVKLKTPDLAQGGRIQKGTPQVTRVVESLRWHPSRETSFTIRENKSAYSPPVEDPQLPRPLRSAGTAY